MVIFSTFILIFVISTFTNFFFRFDKSDEFEKPIFLVGILIIFLNYFYFNFNLSINFIFYLVCIISIISIIYSLITFNTYKKNLINLIYISLPILFLFEIINILYGEQFYVFRGNQQDTFVYTSVGLSFFNYTHEELLNIKNIPTAASNNNYYLHHALNLIHYRPSVGLLIAFLKNISFLDLFFVSYIFKIICSILTIFSLLSLFKYFQIRFIINIALSYIFILSFFYFYNFEIDAYSLILSLPFFILIIKYSIDIRKLFLKFDKNLIKYIFLWGCFFIIYPNGAAIVMPPILILIFYTLIKNNFKIELIKNITISLILFLIIILPTYKTTIIYLYQEIIVGLFHNPDYWGYYGAFLFGKDNPIRDLNVVNQIKEMILNKNSFVIIFNQILDYNFDQNSKLFFLNIIPSLFGYFHFTTNKLSSLNFLLIVILILLNIFLVKKLSKNMFFLFRKNDNFSILIKCIFLYFIVFFTLLIFSGNLWSSIKLYFVINPIFFLLLIFDFSKKNLKPEINLLAILLIFLPLYKYSSFNNGIGKIDSFPSIIHPSNKQNTNWNIDREKLYKCSDLIYDIDDTSEKIFISMVFNESKINNIEKKICKVFKKEKYFKLKEL